MGSGSGPGPDPRGGDGRRSLVVSVNGLRPYHPKRGVVIVESANPSLPPQPTDLETFPVFTPGSPDPGGPPSPVSRSGGFRSLPSSLTQPPSIDPLPVPGIRCFGPEHPSPSQRPFPPPPSLPLVSKETPRIWGTVGNILKVSRDP